MEYNFSGQTTNAAQTELFLSGSRRLLISDNSAYKISGNAVALDISSISAHEWEFSALVKNVAGVVSFVGDPIVTDLRSDTEMLSCLLTLVADSANGSIDPNVTGILGHTIKWNIKLDFAAIGNLTYSQISGYYCSDQDIANIIGTQQLVQLSNDTQGATVTDTDVIEAVIERAQSYIDSELGGTYTTPLVPAPTVIKHICVSLAVYNLFLRRFSIMDMPKQWKDTNDDAIKQINDFAVMEQRLDPALYPVIAASSQFTQAQSGERVFDFSSSNPMGIF